MCFFFKKNETKFISFQKRVEVRLKNVGLKVKKLKNVV